MSGKRTVAFNVLTIGQPVPIPGSVDDGLAPFQVVLIRLAVFVPIVNVENLLGQLPEVK